MLPQDALSHSVESQEVSISVWVNAKNAGASDDYRYSPLFTAYGNEPSAGSEMAIVCPAITRSRPDKL